MRAHYRTTKETYILSEDKNKEIICDNPIQAHTKRPLTGLSFKQRVPLKSNYLFIIPSPYTNVFFLFICPMDNFIIIPFRKNASI